MKHKLSYSLLLSLVVLFSFNLALAQNVTVDGPTTDLHPSTVYSYDVILDDGTGITAFTLPVEVSGAGYLSGSIAVTLGVATDFTMGTDEVLLGYTGPDLGPGPHTLATIDITTSDLCGETFDIATGSFPPAGPMRFAGAGCNVAAAFTGLTGTLYNGTPTCGSNPDENLACGDAIVDKQINASDPIGLDLTYDQISGVGSTDPATGIYNYTPAGDECDFTSTVEVEVTNPCGNSVTCSFAVTYDQEAPILTVPANVVEHWNQGPQVYAATATDDGCPTPSNLDFSIANVSPTPVGALSIDGGTGEVTYDPDCGDVGQVFTVDLEVTDGCETDAGSFTIEVTNDLPTITCPADIDPWYSYMGLISEPFTASDPSDPITVDFGTVLHDGVPADPVVEGMTIVGSYTFEWTPVWTQAGLWEITIVVDDGCFQESCTFSINVSDKYHLSLSETEVNPGSIAEIFLSVNQTEMIGGFNFLITYDPTMAFLEAEAVGDLLDWEYFTYRKSFMDNCGGGCPTGVLRLIGIADNPDGSTPPASAFNPSGDIVKLTFQTPEDLNYVNQCFNIGWAWFDCGDNTISDKTGVILFVAEDTTLLPDPDCLDGFKGQWDPVPWINYDDGEICIRPWDDDRGDINLNGIANEIADAVLYANYFIYGPTSWDYPDDEYYARVQASDINDDGTPQTVADLVYLIGIIAGDKQPYDAGYKVTPFANSVNVSYIMGNDMTVKAFSPVEVGGAAFVFRHTGELGEPVSNVDNMTLKSHDNGEELRVLVYSMDNNVIDAGANELFSVPVSQDANVELVEIQFADASGSQMSVVTAKGGVPTAYELLQNYPNPFNAGTQISFALQAETDWSLKIYNVTGQIVDEFTGHNSAGMVSLHWDADVASGIYFYKLNAGDFTDTKKMVLMK